jgi:hypothetical protein
MQAKSTGNAIKKSEKYRHLIALGVGVFVCIVLSCVSASLKGNVKDNLNSLKLECKKQEEAIEKPKGELYRNLTQARISDIKNNVKKLNQSHSWILKRNNFSPLAIKEDTEKFCEELKKKIGEKTCELDEKFLPSCNLPEVQDVKLFALRLEVAEFLQSIAFEHGVSKFEEFSLINLKKDGDESLFEGVFAILLPSRHFHSILNKLNGSEKFFLLKSIKCSRSESALPEIHMTVGFCIRLVEND